VIAEDAPFGFFDYEVEAFSRVGAVAYAIAETVNRLDLPFFNVRQDGCQGL
jgi:hypothetical protein